VPVAVETAAVETAEPVTSLLTVDTTEPVVSLSDFVVDFKAVVVPAFVVEEGLVGSALQKAKPGGTSGTQTPEMPTAIPDFIQKQSRTETSSQHFFMQQSTPLPAQSPPQAFAELQAKQSSQRLLRQAAST
jgi:hypothetical protein